MSTTPRVDPHVEISPSDEGGWHAISAFELEGLGHLDADPGAWALETERIWRRQDELLGAIATLDDNRWFELHYLAVSDGAGALRVRVVLFAGTRHEERAVALHRALEIHRALEAALPHDLGLYEFESILDGARLRNLWSPFVAGRRVEIVRRAEPDPRSGEAALLPFTGGGPEFAAIPRALVAAGGCARLRVALRPTRLLPWEEGDLRDRLAALAPSGDSPPVGLLASLLCHRDHLLLLRLVAESEGTPLDGLLGAIVRDLTGGGETRVIAGTRATTPLLPTHAAPTDVADGASRVRALFTRDEAVRAFRFPVVREPLHGLPSRSGRLLLAPAAVPVEGIVLGRNGRPAGARPIALGEDARCRHLYAIGQTGTGKSTFLHHLIMQDIVAGRGVCVIDPHGDLVEQVLATLPDERVGDVVLLDPTDDEQPLGLNLLDCRDRTEQDRVAEEFLSLFTRLWPVEFTGPIFQYNIRNTLLLMMHLGAGGHIPSPPSILALPRFLRDAALLKNLQPHIEDPMLSEFVEDTLATSDFHRSELRGYLISKFNVLVGHIAARRMVGQRRPRVDISRAVAEGRILLVRLPSGELGEVAARFLGFLVLLKIQNAILGRAAQAREQRRPFHLYIDEFQNYLTESLPILLAEGRKFAVHIVLANQFLGQLTDEKLRDKLHGAIFGNVGTMVAFRVGNSDAAELARQFGAPVRPQQLITQPNYEAVARVLVAGGAPPVVTLRTEPWPEPPDRARAERARAASRARYGLPSATVNAEIEEEAAVLGRIAEGRERSGNRHRRPTLDE